jgi:DNA-binding NarL/FixJ family response regulator
MNKCRIHIALIEPSDIIYEGLSNLLHQSQDHFFLFKIAGLNELSVILSKEKIHIVIINPTVLQNRTSAFMRIKRKYPNISWLALIHTYHDQELISKMDESLHITDPVERITETLKKHYSNCNCTGNHQEELTERESDVLIQLVKGLSNKEIADALNISIHTVNSHRKNIIEKTGIKSLSGLTIYAITKKIIPLNN